MCPQTRDLTPALHEMFCTLGLLDLVRKMQPHYVLHVCVLESHKEESGEQGRDWVDLRPLGALSRAGVNEDFPVSVFKACTSRSCRDGGARLLRLLYLDGPQGAAHSPLLTVALTFPREVGTNVC